MSVSTTCLYETGAVPNAETTAYTSSSVRTLLDKFSAYATAATDLTIKLVPSGLTAGTTNILAKKTFALGEAYTFPELVGQTLAAGDFISILSSNANAVNLRISGRQVT